VGRSPGRFFKRGWKAVLYAFVTLWQSAVLHEFTSDDSCEDGWKRETCVERQFDVTVRMNDGLSVYDHNCFAYPSTLIVRLCAG
jgi:hypothetical protein